MDRKIMIAMPSLVFAILLLVGCGGTPAAPATTVPPTVVPANATSAATATTVATATTAVTATTAATGTPAAPATSAATETTMAMPTTAPGATMPSMQTMQPNCGKPNCTAPGSAITQNLKGNPATGAQLFVANCQKCHGAEGKGGKTNPGSTDGTIPSLNPVDEDMGKGNSQLFALTLDLFIEHGSTPEGPSPVNTMAAFGDDKKLTPQQIADLIAYIMSLNP